MPKEIDITVSDLFQGDISRLAGVLVRKGLNIDQDTLNTISNQTLKTLATMALGKTTQRRGDELHTLKQNDINAIIDAILDIVPPLTYAVLVFQLSAEGWASET